MDEESNYTILDDKKHFHRKDETYGSSNKITKSAKKQPKKD